MVGAAMQAPSMSCAQLVSIIYIGDISLCLTFCAVLLDPAMVDCLCLKGLCSCLVLGITCSPQYFCTLQMTSVAYLHVGCK